MIPQFLTRMMKSRDAMAKAVATIERALVALDEEAQRLETDDPTDHSWTLHVEGHPVLIDLCAVEGSAFVKVYSPIARLPEEGMLGLYRRLLESNDEMLGAAFAVDDDVIAVQSSRLIEGLDEDEVSVAVYGVAHYGSEAVSELVKEFGARPFFDAPDKG